MYPLRDGHPGCRCILTLVLVLLLSCKHLEELFVVNVFGFISYFRKLFVPDLFL